MAPIAKAAAFGRRKAGAERTDLKRSHQRVPARGTCA